MMEKVDYHIGWNHVIFIWWEQLWRVLLVNIVLLGFAYGLHFLTPVIYNNITDAFKYEEKSSLTIIVLLEMVVSLWAGRESLTDNYSRFRLICESKSTQRSMFVFHHRLSWHTYFYIWWSQMWRMLLVPGAAIGGSLVALMVQHPNAANYTHMLHPMLINICIYAVIVLSLWATREALGDRYRVFRLLTEAKSFYKDGSNA